MPRLCCLRIFHIFRIVPSEQYKYLLIIKKYKLYINIIKSNSGVIFVNKFNRLDNELDELNNNIESNTYVFSEEYFSLRRPFLET